MLPIIATQPYLWGAQQQSPEDGKWLLVTLVVLAVGFCSYFVFVGYAMLVEARAALASAHAWLLQMLVRRQLARHGLSNEQVLETLLNMDEFVFYMGDQLCVCVKGPDGVHQFTNLPSDGLGSPEADTNAQSTEKEKSWTSTESHP